MRNTILRCTAAALGALSIVGVAAAAADDAKEITAGELSFKVPAAWAAEKPSSSMRKAQLKIAPAKGDDEPARLVVFMFPNGAGTVQANIDRWEKEFRDAEGSVPKAKVEAKKGTNVEVTRVETSGRFVAAMAPGAAEANNKPDYRMMGAIVQTPSAGYFFKMVGPEKTMASARDGFDAMIASFTKHD